MFIIKENLIERIQGAIDSGFSAKNYASRIKFFSDGQCNGTCQGVCGGCGYCCQLATKDE